MVFADLANNYLTGSLPTEWGLLLKPKTIPRRLVLDSNLLYGTLPAWDLSSLNPATVFPLIYISLKSEPNLHCTSRQLELSGLTSVETPTNSGATCCVCICICFNTCSLHIYLILEHMLPPEKDAHNKTLLCRVRVEFCDSMLKNCVWFPSHCVLEQATQGCVAHCLPGQVEQCQSTQLAHILAPLYHA